MGQSHKKNKKPVPNNTPQTPIKEVAKEEIRLDKYQPKNISLKLLNNIKHSSMKDPIEEAIIINPILCNSIIIACRSGDIKEVSNILKPNDIKIDILYSLGERIYSLILLKQSSNKLCVGLANKIVIFSLNENHKLKKEAEFQCKEDGEIYSLLELSNGNIISAGNNITLWIKKSPIEYNKSNSVSVGFYKIANLLEFPLYNTIIATQENTHIIYLLKNETNSISCIAQKENIPSIGYKGSAEKLSKNNMILIGKFELNVIDPKNGIVCSRYPGIDRGSLLNLTQNYKENDFWVVSNYFGGFLEFYQQEGNDLIYYDKYEFDDRLIKWGHRLVRINNGCFVITNFYGEIFVFEINKISKK